MLYIDPAKLVGRTYYTHDIKTTYTAIGYGQNDTTFIVGEFPDPTYKCQRITTHKLSECKFTDFKPAPAALPVQPGAPQ
jgi:hypothetical protein